MKIIGIIPARYGSTRFPAKPLAKIGNKTMIEWTYIHSSESKSISEIYVATDNMKIFDAVKSFGGNVIMTSESHETGTDRLIEAIERFSDSEIIINIQGDEPLIESELIDGVLDLKIKNRNFEITTAACIAKENEYNDLNRVKVVFDKNKKALYFSRSLIPSNFKNTKNIYKHIGIYAYEKEFLKKFNTLSFSDLENSESLEQLRVLDNGYSIGVYLTKEAGLSVDNPEDLKIVTEEFIRRKLI